MVGAFAGVALISTGSAVPGIILTNDDSASGGLEKDKAADYAMHLNLTSQVRAVDLALPLIPAGDASFSSPATPGPLLCSCVYVD